MKSPVNVKKLETRIACALREQLERIPALEIRSLETEWPLHLSLHGAPWRADVLAQVRFQDRLIMLICEVKEPSHPRQVRDAIAQLHAHRPTNGGPPVLIVGAAWLSPEARSLCEEFGVGWLDLAGNCRIAFDGVYIEREAAERPKAAARSFKAIFSPKAGQVLRTLLRDPSRAWKVADLAKESGVSLGHVSNVRSALRDREWAAVGDEGLRLTAPDALLDAWRDNYEPVRGERSSWYSVLHGGQMEQALREGLSRPGTEGLAMLGGLSAAHWLAPYLRGSTTAIYADASMRPHLVESLKLRSAKGGANVEIVEPDDPDILKERTQLVGAPPVSSPILTYLDLTNLDDRGQEAANYLREKLLKWH